jgi:transcriptional regulator with GAF, ATPase, and Fis domain
LVTELQLGERRVLVGDPAMVRLYELIRRLAVSELPVLISGETGTGKENAAFAVHCWSRRSEHPFVAINCAAIAETLVESELFGHEKGAFTGATAAKPGLFEVAAGGTVFLDEVGELSLAVQAKLLRVLESRRILRVGGIKEYKIDVRIVAATHRLLEKEVAAGRFRQDLYFRLGVATVVLPPLRDRPRELGLLAQRFLDDACTAAGRSHMMLAPATLAALEGYGWPGNVRELKNTMEYVACVAAAQSEEVVEAWHLPERVAVARPQAPASSVNAQAVEAEESTLAASGVEATPASASPEPSLQQRRPFVEELRAIERERMREALRATGGVKVRAAELLHMPLRTFKFKCRQYGL